METVEEITTRGIYTSLSLTLNGGDGRVWATVRNDITLFPSTVIVIAELYSSDVYEENHENMTIVTRVASMDLNMGESLVADGYTNGEDKYWQGRMRYKVDEGDWVTKDTGTFHFDGEGNLIGVL